MQTALMECIRYIFPAGAQAWLTPTKTPRLACQQICDALGRNKHGHFCSFWPKLRRSISPLYCFYIPDINAFLLVEPRRFLKGSLQKQISNTFHTEHLSCFQAYSIKRAFLILMEVSYMAREVRHHSLTETTPMSDAECKANYESLIHIYFTPNIS